MKRLMIVLCVRAVIGLASAATQAARHTFGSGSLTTTDSNPWGGYNSQNYSVGGYGFNVDAGPVTAEYLGVSLYSINYTGDMGWPPDPTDTGAPVIVGLGNGTNIAQYECQVEYEWWSAERNNPRNVR